MKMKNIRCFIHLLCFGVLQQRGSMKTGVVQQRGSMKTGVEIRKVGLFLLVRLHIHVI